MAASPTDYLVQLVLRGSYRHVPSIVDREGQQLTSCTPLLLNYNDVTKVALTLFFLLTYLQVPVRMLRRGLCLCCSLWLAPHALDGCKEFDLMSHTAHTMSTVILAAHETMLQLTCVGVK